MKELLMQAEKLATEELKRANEKNPPFASAHEGYAVLLEEVEEAKDDLARTGRNMVDLWNQIKVDKVDTRTVNRLWQSAWHCAAECIQVMAMADKFRALLKEKERNE